MSVGEAGVQSRNPSFSSVLMDPYYEQRLREEVIYLHSLWHQGPPRNPNPNPNRTHHNPSTHLQLSNPTQFKKEKKTRKDRFRGKKGKSRPPEADPPWVSDIEWPIKKPAETPSSSALGWPALNLPPARTTRLPSAEEQARFAATQAQQKALKAAQEFFAASDGDEDEDGGSDEDDDFMDEDGHEEYSFFMKVFTEDGELRDFYEKNFEGGDFCCLVCEGIGKKIGKRFKGCVALVQHSITIAKTKKKQAHRAFGQVICKVLGWNIDRLPTIVLTLGDPLGRALAKSGESQGNAEVGMEGLHMLNQNLGSENVNNGELIAKEVSNVGQEEELHNSSVPGMSNVDGDNVMLCESSSKVGDASECTENLDNGDSSIADGKTEGVVNGLCRNLVRTMVLETKMTNNQMEIVVVNDLKNNNENQN